jgi:hypothetical protein
MVAGYSSKIYVLKEDGNTNLSEQKRVKNKNASDGRGILYML